MTTAESIIMGAAQRSKVKSSRALADRIGMPYTTLRYKLNHPRVLTLSDLAWISTVCVFTPEESYQLLKSVKGGIRR